MLARYEGRIAAIIGGGSGMGRSISHRIAAEGGHVYVADLSEDGAQSVAEEIRTAGGAATAIRVDATDRADLKTLFGKIDADHGVLHALHAQVGMPGPAGLRSSTTPAGKRTSPSTSRAPTTRRPSASTCCARRRARARSR